MQTVLSRHVEVYSELGVGTTFKVYLPRVEEAVEQFGEIIGQRLICRPTELDGQTITLAVLASP